MKNKSKNSTKSKKKLLPPIKIKKEPISFKITNKSSNKKETNSNIDKQENTISEAKAKPVRISLDQNLSIDMQPKKRLSSSMASNHSTEKALEKQRTTLGGNSSGGAFNPESAYQLDKRQRFEIYKRRLLFKPPAKDAEEAIKLINNTLDEIEEKYAPKKDDKFYALNSKRFGRMWPIPADRIKVNPETGKTEMLAVGLTIQINKNGAFEVWTITRGNQLSKKIFFKTGQIKTVNNVDVCENQSSVNNES